MAGSKTMIEVSGIDVQVVRKDIKNLHLAVYPPDGHVRVAVPMHIADENVRLAVISKLGWIKAQQQDFKNQPRQSVRKYISGECHYFFGKGYRLQVVERSGTRAEIQRLKSGKLKMFIRPGTPVESRERLLNRWYRDQLKASIPELLDKWQPVIGKKADFCGIKKMKTKWGSCNIERRRIWLNLELVKKPVECLEYILVHELVHLWERQHNKNFATLMDQFLPGWRQSRDILRSGPLAHEDWAY